MLRLDQRASPFNAHLGMQLLDVLLPHALLRVRLAREHRHQAVQRLTLPIADQRLMHAVLGRQLRDRQLAAYHLQRNARLEPCRVTLPFAHHQVRPS